MLGMGEEVGWNGGGEFLELFIVFRELFFRDSGLWEEQVCIGYLLYLNNLFVSYNS